MSLTPSSSDSRPSSSLSFPPSLVIEKNKSSAAESGQKTEGPITSAPDNTILSHEQWKNALCVFCGSSEGNDPEFLKAADQLGKALADEGIPLVYGGGTNGLMGRVAASTHESNGLVLGIIPRALMNVEREKSKAVPSGILSPVLAAEAKESDRSLVVPVETMHQRKQEMANMSGLGFIALPGGYGTLEEVAEMTTWTQLGIHTKPVILLNVSGFYSALRTFVEAAISSGFIKASNGSFMVFVDKPDGDEDFDWGKAAVEAVRRWHKGEKGEAYKLKWEGEKAR